MKFSNESSATLLDFGEADIETDMATKYDKHIVCSFISTHYLNNY